MTLSLKVAGSSFEGWTSAQVTRSMEQLAGSFALTLAGRGADNLPVVIGPGGDCQVSLDGEVVITGYIDRVRINYSKDSHELEVSGRDKSGDLVDCSAIHDPGEWMDIGLQEIAEQLCEPFGIAVMATDVGETFRKFRIETGETVFEAIDRACRMRGVIATADRNGGLRIGPPETSSAGVRLALGENIIAAAGLSSWTDRYSDYQVLSQQPGNDDIEAEEATHITATARDAVINRHRPLTILAEQSADQDETQERADWEARVRETRTREVSVTVQGWREAGEGSPLWDFGRRTRLIDDFMGINRELLVAQVTQSLSSGGTTTKLKLLPVGAFERRVDAEVTEQSDETVNWWL